MVYCFIRDDLERISSDNPLAIQSAYAKAINKFCMIDISTENVVDQNQAVIDIAGKSVFLRGSCDSFSEALRLLQQKGADLLENQQDVQKVLHWEQLCLAKRKVVSAKSGDLLSGRYSEDVREILMENAVVFVKSREKGFSAKVASKRLVNGDPELAAVIKKHCTEESDVLLSELMHIKHDSMGKKESRHFIRNNQILNSSRPICSLVHNVPLTLRREAEKIVSHIALLEDFPSNYVLDLALVEKTGEVTTDIIEFNPIGTSMCYVNNSIFTEEWDGLSFDQNGSAYGFEYQLDMQYYPQRYKVLRNSGERYSYISSEEYEFL